MPWKDDLVSKRLLIDAGELLIPTARLGVEINEGPRESGCTTGEID